MQALEKQQRLNADAALAFKQDVAQLRHEHELVLQQERTARQEAEQWQVEVQEQGQQAQQALAKQLQVSLCAMVAMCWINRHVRHTGLVLMSSVKLACHAHDWLCNSCVGT